MVNQPFFAASNRTSSCPPKTKPNEGLVKKDKKKKEKKEENTKEKEEISNNDIPQMQFNYSSDL